MDRDQKTEANDEQKTNNKEMDKLFGRKVCAESNGSYILMLSDLRTIFRILNSQGV